MGEPRKFAELKLIPSSVSPAGPPSAPLVGNMRSTNGTNPTSASGAPVTSLSNVIVALKSPPRGTSEGTSTVAVGSAVSNMRSSNSSICGGCQLEFIRSLLRKLVFGRDKSVDNNITVSFQACTQRCRFYRYCVQCGNRFYSNTALWTAPNLLRHI